MLSYMPLAFNLLAPWGHTLERASGYLLEMLPAFTGTARQLLFEHSPGRGNPKFTGDYTAFDALIRYSDCHDRNGFIAFEIKYSEAMREPISELKPRHAEISDAGGLFTDPAAARRTGLTRCSNSGARPSPPECQARCSHTRRPSSGRGPLVRARAARVLAGERPLGFTVSNEVKLQETAFWRTLRIVAHRRAANQWR
jgi:hypothetical protein